MTRSLLLAGFCALVTAGGAAAQEAPAPATDGFDNPKLGSVPCIVLNRYDVEPAGQSQYRASAGVENICGRTLDVEFCFLTTAEEGEVGRSCYGAALRPWMKADVTKPGGPGRVVGTDYRWKYAR